MREGETLSLEQIRAFLEGSEEIRFEGQKRKQIYRWIEKTQVEQQYHLCSKADKGLLRRYVEKMTGLSRAQVTRLISQYVKQGRVKEGPYRRRRFPNTYTRADVELLAQVDEAHRTLSGPATQKILVREFHDYGKRAYERLARISVAHIYNLRESQAYRKQRVVMESTKPISVSIGERRRPDPQSRPGYLRVDTVHQGDWDKAKGVYHINAVDEVTQWQVMGAAAQVTEAHLLPALEGMLKQFPFQVKGFHSDNGSEFINHRVSQMLQNLLVEQTKSRPRHSNDNGLAETKNGAVVRKHMGYGHIEAGHAAAISRFYEEHFHPYLNYHRAVWRAGSGDEREREAAESVSMVRDTVGDPAAGARM